MGDALKIFVLSVHYAVTEFAAEQCNRILECLTPEATSIYYCPIIHQWTESSVADILGSHLFHISLGKNDNIREGHHGHGDSLVAAYHQLKPAIGNDDLVLVLDHDAHPISAFMLYKMVAWLKDNCGCNGIGIPWWRQGGVYLHPSCAMIRAKTVKEMGPTMAFRNNWFGENTDRQWDNLQGFTVWHETHKGHVDYFKVFDTKFPYTKWDSDIAVNESPCLIGEHGENVTVGYLMHYGFSQDHNPLVSHLWHSDPWVRKTKWKLGQAQRQYLEEPLRRNE